MAKVMIVSTTGVPHSATFIDYKDLKYADRWISFEPGSHFTNGQVVDWSFEVENAITFDIPDTTVYQAEKQVREQYTGSTYFIGVRDCVSFSADFASYCGLMTTSANFTPYGFLLALSYYNKYEIFN
jgi:hypothetical protein